MAPQRVALQRALGETPAFAPDPTKRCAVRALQGAFAGERSSGTVFRYEVCLSKSQYQKLFNSTKPQKLGCGTYACAYSVAGKKHTVVKITRDPEDVAALLAAYDPRVARVRKVFQLVNAGARTNTNQPVPLYALEMERLYKVPGFLAKWINRTIMAMHTAINFDALQHGARPQDYRFSQTLLAHMKTRCEDIAPGNASCPRFLDEFSHLHERLFKKGIWWQDFHAGNFGVTLNGKWKALDLGVSGARLAGPLPLLAGAMQNLPKKTRKVR